MPTLSFFYGIKIQMYWYDHAPPHFHIESGGYRAVWNVITLEVIAGVLPASVHALVLQWAQLHHAEIMEAWEKCANGQPPQKIPPLP